MLRAERDTIPAGPWWRSPASSGRSEFARSPTTALRATYGQLARVERVAGNRSLAREVRTGLTVSSNRVVLIPVGYGADCRSLPWRSSAAWIPPGEPSLLIARPRSRSQWIKGIPTFDVSAFHEPYPHAAFLKYEVPDATKGEWLSVAEYWELLERLPIDGPEVLRDLRLGKVRVWIAADSTRAQRFPANAILSAITPKG